MEVIKGRIRKSTCPCSSIRQKQYVVVEHEYKRPALGAVKYNDILRQTRKNQHGEKTHTRWFYCLYKDRL